MKRLSREVINQALEDVEHATYAYDLATREGKHIEALRERIRRLESRLDWVYAIAAAAGLYCFWRVLLWLWMEDQGGSL